MRDEMDEEARLGRFRRLPGRARLLRIVAALVCFLALSAMLLVGQLEVRSDLRVTLPDAVPKGARYLPLRALLYRNLSAVEGPTLAYAAARARTCDLQLVCGPFTELKPGLGPSMEGVLPVPESAHEALVVRLQVTPEGAASLSFQAVVRVVDSAVRGPLPTPRPMRRLQQMAHGPIRRESGGIPAGSGPGGLIALPRLDELKELQVVVGGGVCVPEQDCELFAIAAGNANEISFQPSGSVSFAEASTRHLLAPAILRQLATVHGPEGQVRLSAKRGEFIDSRHVRLPVALGASALHPGRRLRVAGEQLTLQVAAFETGPCIVDAFTAGYWVRTATIDRCEAPFRVPFALPIGLTRLQIRRDPFSEQGAAVRVVATVPLGATVEAALPMLLESASVGLRARLSGELPSASDLSLMAPAHRRAFGELLAAQLEEGLSALPPPLSDQARARAELQRRKRLLRWLALLSITLAGAAVVLLVGHSGARGSAQVEALLSAAGSEAAVRRRSYGRRRWALALVLVSLVLAFFSMGLYVLARTG